MIVRIVRLHFHEDQVSTFLEIFSGHRERIRHFPGCTRLELHRDPDHPSTFATISHWQSAADLENYRQSPLFKEVWGKVKPLFRLRSEAFTLEKVDEVL
ncbi:MAG: antibiotic biosynthesis monooxygenase [Cyclobacteriaceae bacterium]|nr:antibiotic biosynthesis monooxygenase [Cyclobacteriaceae bacterium]